MRVFHLLAAMLAVLSVPLSAQQVSRQWTDLQGRTVEAAFAGLEGDSVLLRMGNGQTVPFPLARLSEADQAFARSAGGGGTAPAPATDPVRLPIEKRIWPGTVTVPTRSVEIRAVEENAAARRYVYQSEAFEFTSQAKLAGSVMTEVARTFEATRAVIDAHALAAHAGVTALNDRLLVVRALAPVTEPASDLWRQIRAAWRAAFWQLPASAPRIWAM